jgi:CD36 family
MRFQANFLVKNDDDIALFQNLPTLFIPAMWVEQKFVLDSDTSKVLKIALTIPYIGRLVGLGLMAIGFVFVIIAWLIRCISNCRGNRSENDLNLTPVTLTSQNRHHGDRSSPLLAMRNKNISIKKMNGENN